MPQLSSRYNSHVIRILILLVILALVGLAAKASLVPATFNKYGHYRADAIVDEINRPIRNMTNESCLACHADIKKIHLAGDHKTVSCEFCHGPNADHAQGEKLVGKMPVKRGAEIKILCLRCHNKIIRARPEEAIKVVAMPDHLREKHVQESHICDQCHLVHAPLKWVNEAKLSMGLIKEEEEKLPWMK